MALDALTPEQLAFVETNHAAAMITVGKDGFAKAARIAYAVIDGKIWSSGTADRIRTKRLRRDPRCTLYVHEPVFDFLTLETEVSILEGPDSLDSSVLYFRTLHGVPEGPFSTLGEDFADDEALKAYLVANGRLLYQFEPTKAWGRIRD